MAFFQKIIDYLDITKLFRKDRSQGLNLRFMHGINRISIFMFIICLIIILIKLLS